MDKDQVYDVRPAGGPARKGAGRPGLQAWARQHRLQLMAGGAGAVVLLALVARRRASTSAASGSASPTRVVPPGSSYGDPQDFRGAAGAGVYDSTASDVYNSLQPQIEQVQRSIEALAGLAPGTPIEPVVTMPEAAPKPPPAPTSPTSTYQPPPAAAATPVAPAAVAAPTVSSWSPPVYSPSSYSSLDAVTAPRLDNPSLPPSHTNPILRPGDAPSPGYAPRPGGTLAEIAASQAQFMPTPTPTPAPRTSIFKRFGVLR